MNIEQAKEQVRKTVRAYALKDEYGNLRMSAEKQRPLFLYGPPGVGKTAIVAQVAGEMEIGFVSYSMTHHTRQSALGLPFIHDEVFEGKEYRVSEYTMSEIIASVYRQIRATGRHEGILFLDEINCVSETLVPAMLLFLQYKVFGQHRVPDGWTVVTAGNPPEYNRSAREFDMVTWDRVKKITVEPDYPSWRAWALKEGTHPAVISYLDLHTGDFYNAESTVSGRSFTTPRGWSDLSEMMRLYETAGEEIDSCLFEQYLQDERIAARFGEYFRMWSEYESGYRVRDILTGHTAESSLSRARKAEMDERCSLINLLLSAVHSEAEPLLTERKALLEIRELIKNRSAESAEEKCLGRIHAGVSHETEAVLRKAILFSRQFQDPQTYRRVFMNERDRLRSQAGVIREHMENIFRFLEEAYGEGNEILLAVTGMTSDAVTASFIALYGCDGYYRHQNILQFEEREKKIDQMIDELESD